MYVYDNHGVADLAIANYARGINARTSQYGFRNHRLGGAGCELAVRTDRSCGKLRTRVASGNGRRGEQP
jgi:hypothetical protein